MAGGSTQYAVPPPALLSAIDQAAREFSVPVDLLVGIWRTESGSTYPNPAVNSSGYGGLFGTRDPFGTTQAQANLAASILANGLRQSGGNVAGALSYYNSGKTSGGYTSVPGETTFGTIPVPPQPPGGALSFPGGSTTSASNPGTGGVGQPSGSSGGIFSTITHALEQAATGDPLGAAATEAGALFGINLSNLDPVKGLTAVLSPIGTVFVTLERFLGKLPAYLVRGGLLLGGAILVIVGFGLTARGGLASGGAAG